VRRLSAPFDALIVAGEHASSAFPGYMEGALESGVRAARLAWPE
jgi:monoamine oxidase